MLNPELCFSREGSAPFRAARVSCILFWNNPSENALGGRVCHHLQPAGKNTLVSRVLKCWGLRPDLWEGSLLPLPARRIFLPTSQVRLPAVSMRIFKPSPCSQVPWTPRPASAGHWFHLGFNGSPSRDRGVPVQPRPLRRGCGL